jgi:flagellar biosynthesis protein FliR
MEVLVWSFCLVFARVATFVAVVPLFGTMSMPRLVKAGLVLALTVVWYVPLVEGAPPTFLWRSTDSMSWVSHFVAIGREIFLGGILGYGLGLFLVPVHVAGEYLTQEMGLAFANQVNPTTGASSSPITQIFDYMGTALFFGVDGHHVLLGVLHATFAQYPILGSLPDSPLPRLVAGATMAEEWGLMLAAPVAMFLFLTTVLLAFLTRAAPQMNLYAVGFPLRLGVGLSACVLLLPSWVSTVVSAFCQFGQLVGQWM